MWDLFCFISGIVLGTIFHAVFVKWFGKAKSTASELVHDISEEAKKAAAQSAKK